MAFKTVGNALYQCIRTLGQPVPRPPCRPAWAPSATDHCGRPHRPGINRFRIPRRIAAPDNHSNAALTISTFFIAKPQSGGTACVWSRSGFCLFPAEGSPHTKSAAYILASLKRKRQHAAPPGAAAFRLPAHTGLPMSSKNPILGLCQQATFLISAAKVDQCPDDQGWEVASPAAPTPGKSSALNTLTHANLARTSKTPGRTQLLNFFRLDDERRLVDLPGYGYAKVPIPLKQHWQKHLEATWAAASPGRTGADDGHPSSADRVRQHDARLVQGQRRCRCTSC